MKKFYHGVSALAFVVAGVSLSAQTTTFSYTGSVQTYVVPACVNAVTIDAQGAQGGGPSGGLGGRAIATVPVTPGSTLYVYVGGQPTTRPGPGSGGFNGGGLVNALPCGGGTNDGWGGGGASDVRTTVSLNDRIIVGGGGGGQGWTSGAGGAGGGLQGADGAASWIAGTQGFGGTQTAGGAGGYYTGNSQSAGSGTFGYGGDAGPVTTYCIGGGGGGGYYGGGGGYVSAGAGGSSYISYPGSTSTSTTAGFRSGNGQIMITPASTGAPAAPTAVSGTSPLCAGSSASFSINPVAGATSYTWTVPSGATINSGQGTTSINVTFGSTSGNISVTADNVCGSSAATSYSVTVVVPPTVVANSSASSICNGDYVTLTGSGAITYSWSNGVTDGLGFAPTSTITYTVTGTDMYGCSNTATTTIVVNANPVVTIGPDITQCEGAVLLDAGNSGATYLWSDATTSQMLLVTTSGTYYVDVTDGNGCMGSDTAVITINLLPNVTASSAIPMPCLDDDSVALTGTPSGGTWSGNGVFGSTFSPSNAGLGNHTATYSYTDGNGCTDTAQVNITVDACLGVPNADVPQNVTIYPNPNNGTFTLNSNVGCDELQIEITDLQGRVVYTSTLSDVQAGSTTQITLDVADGIYIIRTNSAEEQFVQRINIQR